MSLKFESSSEPLGTGAHSKQSALVYQQLADVPTQSIISAAGPAEIDEIDYFG